MGAESGAQGAGKRWFVGRDDVIRPVLAFLDEPGRGHRLETGGTWGIGKTWFVDELQERASGHAVVLHVRAGLYVPRAAPTHGAAPETVQLLRNFESYTRLLDDLVDDAPETEEWGTLAEKIAAARNAVAKVEGVRPYIEKFAPEIKVGGDVDLRDNAVLGGIVMQGEEPVLRLEATIADEREKLHAAFVETVDRVAGASGAVVLVDEFDRLQGHEVARWLLALVTGIQQAVVVVTTRVRGEELEERAQELERERLGLFDEAAVREYLEKRLGADAATDTLVQRVLAFSRGLPQAVAMACDLIEQRRATGGELSLDDVAIDPAGPTTDLLSAIVAEVPEPDVSLLLREGRLARRIDDDVIHYLLFGKPLAAGSRDERARARAAREALLAYSFVEEYDAANKDGLGRYRFHEYITRAPAATAALRIDAEGVHERVAAYYERRLDKYDEERSGESAYMQWYKFEQRRWQALMLEWLHHAAQLSDEDSRTAVRLELARVFLQAFWWWGCYMPFAFCEQLLDDWDRTQPEPERAWSGRLRTLLDCYPKGHEKLDAGDWAKVEQALRALRREGGVEGKLEGPPGDDRGARKLRSNRRWVRALTSLFLAHSYRFRTGMAELAMPLYDDALKHLHDRSARAWTTFERAELKLALGDAGAAGDLRAAAELLEHAGEEDLELLANLHRLRGDIAAANGDDELAIDATARAVLHAYAFLVEPYPPDVYTVAFYDEMRTRAQKRLDGVRKDRGEAAAAAAERRLLERLEILRQPFGLDGRELPPPPAPTGESALADELFTTTAQKVLLAVRSDPASGELRS